MKKVLLALCLTGVLSSCCILQPGPQLRNQVGESVVFEGVQTATLAGVPLPETKISVRNTYLKGPGSVEFTEGRDFAVDYSLGTLKRLPGSRLPDFSTNSLYGQAEFDHSRFPGFGNAGFFAFIDYTFAPSRDWPVQAPQTQFLKASRAKLENGQPLKIVAFGDSITAGGDASKPELIFWMRWANALQRKYPKALVTAVNGATGGDSTVQGLQRLEAKVLAEKPDLVLVGFGMNDHNVQGVPIPQFKQNLRTIVDRIRKESGAEIILFSAFPPNPKWKFGSHRMAEYAAATLESATELQCAYADVFTNWQAVAARKKPEDMLGNNINHPNDFGHWIYYSVFQALGL